MKKVRVQMATQENFAPFGQVLETENRPYGGEAGMYNWYEKQAAVEGAEVVSVIAQPRIMLVRRLPAASG